MGPFGCGNRLPRRSHVVCHLRIEAGHLMAQSRDFLIERQDTFDAFEVHACLSERHDPVEPSNVGVGITTPPGAGSLRSQLSLALPQTQSLRVNTSQFGCDGNDVNAVHCHTPK